MAAAAPTLSIPTSPAVVTVRQTQGRRRQQRQHQSSFFSSVRQCQSTFPSCSQLLSSPSPTIFLCANEGPARRSSALACVSPVSSSSPSSPSSKSTTKLYVSGLSFRTTEDSLRNAFQNFGQLVEVNLVMDKLANRPRGFAFICYATEKESKKAIEGMHGKFLDGRVIFVEVAKPRSELRNSRPNPEKPWRS
ncbi:hypothetical protein Ancab_029786 [Ancistrocladus abbreviatus]